MGNWSFAIVNGRLVEIHFDRKYGFWGHCYVKRSEYKTKQERRWIKQDTAQNRFTYRKGYYFDQLRGTKHKIPKCELLFPRLKNTKITSLKESSRKKRGIRANKKD